MARKNGDPAIMQPITSNGWNPRKVAKKKPKRRFPPEVLSPEEIAALMDVCANTPAGIRNRALITILYRAGLRINEALALRPKDLDPRNGAIRVLFAKGGQSRTVGMDGQAFDKLLRWLEIRADLGINGRDPVFCLLDGKLLADSYIRVLFPRLGRQAGIDKRVHAHGLRHTHASELRAEGLDIGVISKQLGHRSIATTARYLDHIAPFAVIEALQGRTW
ncbi:MAG: site-specific integrase [Planctomycetota bacterium]|nr:site-specific integrase [Planctomycetota bacterium]